MPFFFVVFVFLGDLIIDNFARSSCAALLPAGRIVIATTAVTATVGKKTAIAGGRAASPRLNDEVPRQPPG